MKLKDVAEFMGVSERTVRNYSAAGKLTPSYVPGKTSPVAEFDENEVKNLKEELSTTVKPERVKVEVRKPEAGNQSSELAIIPKAEKPETITSGFPIEQLPALALALANVIEAGKGRAGLPERMLLTVPEAAQVSGISEHTLRKAAKAGDLKFRRIGRSDKVLPEELKAWVTAQFN